MDQLALNHKKYNLSIKLRTIRAYFFINFFEELSRKLWTKNKNEV
jgi:hypothetical protein